jgi:hypothetical protein
VRIIELFSFARDYHTSEKIVYEDRPVTAYRAQPCGVAALLEELQPRDARRFSAE